jgi:hypothetical protein
MRDSRREKVFVQEENGGNEDAIQSGNADSIVVEYCGFGGLQQ